MPPQDSQDGAVWEAEVELATETGEMPRAGKQQWDLEGTELAESLHWLDQNKDAIQTF